MAYPGFVRRALVLALLCSAGSAAAQGVLMPGAGPIHRSMAGASTAAPLDAIGAVYWNPAAISGLHRSQVDIGSEFIYTDMYLSSSVPAGSIAPRLNFPATSAAGRTRSDNGLAAIPSIALVYQPDDSPLTLGLGLVAIGGGSVNYPSDPTNPVLAPQGPLQRIVLGQQTANLSILQVSTNVSCELLDRLYLGVGPTVNIIGMMANPPIFGGLNDANGDGIFSFPSGTGSRPFWGGGFRAGLYWEATDTVAVGFSFISPQWFEPFRFNSKDENGDPLRIGFKFGLPMTLSWGVAYTGIENLLLTADVRYFDYRSADLFGTRVRDGGLGWDDVWAVAVGGQYRLNDRASVRAGYLYNQAPIPETATLFNIQVPGITQHAVSVGMSLRVTDNIDMSLAYVHAFESKLKGNLAEERGIFTEISLEADSLLFGLTVRFGQPAAAPTAAAPAACATAG